MNQKQEREALEKLLADVSILSAAYTDNLRNAGTLEQFQKMQKRQMRYDAIRMLIGDLMMG